jgi:hypothetical protein
MMSKMTRIADATDTPTLPRMFLMAVPIPTWNDGHFLMSDSGWGRLERSRYRMSASSSARNYFPVSSSLRAYGFGSIEPLMESMKPVTVPMVRNQLSQTLR